MKKTLKALLSLLLIISCLAALASCSGKKQYSLLEGYWITKDDETSVIIGITIEADTNHITFIDEGLESGVIGATFTIKGKSLIITCTDPEDIKYLGGKDNELTAPYKLSNDGLGLTLTYAGKTVSLVKFTTDLSNIPNLDQLN